MHIAALTSPLTLLATASAVQQVPSYPEYHARSSHFLQGLGGPAIGDALLTAIREANATITPAMTAVQATELFHRMASWGLAETAVPPEVLQSWQLITGLNAADETDTSAAIAGYFQSVRTTLTTEGICLHFQRRIDAARPIAIGWGFDGATALKRIASPLARAEISDARKAALFVRLIDTAASIEHIKARVAALGYFASPIAEAEIGEEGKTALFNKLIDTARLIPDDSISHRMSRTEALWRIGLSFAAAGSEECSNVRVEEGIALIEEAIDARRRLGRGQEPARKLSYIAGSLANFGFEERAAALFVEAIDYARREVGYHVCTYPLQDSLQALGCAKIGTERKAAAFEAVIAATRQISECSTRVCEFLTTADALAAAGFQERAAALYAEAIRQERHAEWYHDVLPTRLWSLSVARIGHELKVAVLEGVIDAVLEGAEIYGRFCEFGVIAAALEEEWIWQGHNAALFERLINVARQMEDRTHYPLRPFVLQGIATSLVAAGFRARAAAVFADAIEGTQSIESRLLRSGMVQAIDTSIAAAGFSVRAPEQLRRIAAAPAV